MVAFIGHTRNLVTHRTSSESTDEKTLEDIRDLLLKIEDAQSPHDIDISSHMLTWDFSTGIARCSHPIIEEWLYWDTTSWSQLSSIVLPRSGGNFIEMTAMIDHTIAEQAISAHCRQRARLRFRTILKKVYLPKGVTEVRRYVRAVVSPSYQPIANSAILNMVLNEIGNANMLRFDLGDKGMFGKILVGDMPTEVHEQTAVINVWNSDTKLKTAGVGVGTFRKICSNGLTAHTSQGEKTFIHRGSSIIPGIKRAIPNFVAHQTLLVDSYNRSLKVELDDPHAYLERKLKNYKECNSDVIKGIKDSMNHWSSSRYGTLANIVDGITHYAHTSKSDVWQTMELEKIAVRIMDKGLKEIA